MERLIRLPEVMEKIGYKRATIYRLMEAGEFPKNINLGERATAWVESEIDAWIKNKLDKRQDHLPVKKNRTAKGTYG